MKKEFSFYEFVGLLIPGSLLLFGVNFLVLGQLDKPLFAVEKIGDTVVFLILAYTTGHFIQALGNIIEKVIWWFFGGMPTQWLLTKNNFKKKLFSEPLNQKISDKVTQKFGIGFKEVGGMAYNTVFIAGKSARIDIFNGNYSLFRGLFVASLSIAVGCIIQYHFNWWQNILVFTPSVLMLRRMIRFAIYYAKETYKTFYNL